MRMEVMVARIDARIRADKELQEFLEQKREQREQTAEERKRLKEVMWKLRR